MTIEQRLAVQIANLTLQLARAEETIEKLKQQQTQPPVTDKKDH